MTAREFAILHGVSESRVRKWIQQGRVKVKIVMHGNRRHIVILDKTRPENRT